MKETLSKTCVCCGRDFEWRKKWDKSWDQVRYCSDLCRRRKWQVRDGFIEEDILERLRACSPKATICPSESARDLFSHDWKSQMERVRAAARRLVSAGKLQITQGGRVVDPSAAKGTIRLQLKAGRD